MAGFVLNRFRGDPSLLAPGPQILEDMTGVPTLGVVPMVDHGLPDEDGAAEALPGATGRRVRIVRGPAASNLDEWWPMREASDCRWATSPAHLTDAELVVLPGSKFPAADLAWMAATDMDAAIRRADGSGVPILAVCGGTQALGEVIQDPSGVEHGGTVAGLGLLPARTLLGPEKTVRRSPLTFSSDLGGPFEALAGLRVEGYEIHYGQTTPTGPLQAAAIEGSGFVAGNMLAIFHHGICEDSRVLQALVGAAPRRTLAEVLDGLADLAEAHLDLDAWVPWPSTIARGEARRVAAGGQHRRWQGQVVRRVRGDGQRLGEGLARRRRASSLIHPWGRLLCAERRRSDRPTRGDRRCGNNRNQCLDHTR